VTATVNGAFDQLSMMVDRVRTALLDEKAREVKFHDTCVSEKHQAELQLTRRQHDSSTFNASMQKLGIVVSEANSSIAELESEISDLQDSLEQATENLDEGYTNFTEAIQAEEAKQAKLHQAKAILARVYATSSSTETWLLQTGARGAARNSTNSETTTRAPRPQGYTTEVTPHTGGTQMESILELLIEDSKSSVQSMRRSMQDGSDAMSKSAGDISQSIRASQTQLVVIKAKKADAELKLEQITGQEAAVKVEIGEVNEFLTMLAGKCDWITGNFAASQAARQAQIDNLRKAKQAFVGAVHTGF